MANLGLGQEMYKMNLEHLVISESKKKNLSKILRSKLTQTLANAPISQRRDNLMNKMTIAMDQNTSNIFKSMNS